MVCAKTSRIGLSTKQFTIPQDLFFPIAIVKNINNIHKNGTSEGNPIP